MTRESAVWMAIGADRRDGARRTGGLHGEGHGESQHVDAVVGPNGQVRQHEPATQAEYQRAAGANPNQTEYQLSVPRSIALWVAAFFTLAILSLPDRDNPLYRIAEAMLVGWCRPPTGWSWASGTCWCRTWRGRSAGAWFRAGRCQA